MSAFSDIMTSFGEAKPVAPRPRTSERPKETTGAGPTTAATPVNHGVKRKAEDALDSRSNGRLVKTSTVTTSPMKKQNGAITAIKSSSTTISTISTPPAPPKAPPKGSYMAMLARAKEKQQERGGSQVGLIKHQIGTKEKSTKSSSQDQVRQGANTGKIITSKTTMTSKTERGKRSASPIKNPHTDSLKSRKGLKSKEIQASPKTSSTQSPKRPTYKGTMGRSRDGQPQLANPAGASSNGKHNASATHKRRKPVRNDEYLGTDEDENSDDEGSNVEGFEDDDHYGSDASSDMEAGAFEVAEEESRAERQARLEDKKELNEEQRLKKEKDERRRRLELLAKKNSGRKQEY